jgi:hypothetical protein
MNFTKLKFTCNARCDVPCGVEKDEHMLGFIIDDLLSAAVAPSPSQGRTNSNSFEPGDADFQYGWNTQHGRGARLCLEKVIGLKLDELRFGTRCDLQPGLLRDERDVFFRRLCVVPNPVPAPQTIRSGPLHFLRHV